MKVQGLILALLLPWSVQAEQQYYGTRASSVALSGTEFQADLQTLPLHAGDVITPENLRASIQALYDTGHYRYIEVDANASVDGGTALTFGVKPNYFFSTFRLEPENLLDQPLSGHFRLPVGEKFSTSAVDRLVQDTADLLKSEGYFQVTVTAGYDFDEDTHLVAVTLKATTGPKAKVGNVQLQGGEETFPNRELPNGFELKMGDDFSASKLDKAVSDIRKKFIDLNFLNTRVTAERDYEAATNTVDLNVTVQPGQFALVQPRGFDIPKNKLRDLVPVFEEGTVDQDLVNEGSAAIVRYMQREGYFDAEITFEIIEVDPALGNAIQINYSINPGTRHEIADVRIAGNQHFTTDEIRRRMKTRKGHLLDRGVFSTDLLDEDRQTIESMYRNAGFEGTVVTAMPEDLGHSITVFIQIQEGKLLPIDFITIIGNSAISGEELRGALRLKEGETYIPGAVDQARAALTQLYYKRGYADVRVERTVERVETNNGVRVTFQITEGRPYQIGSILVAGNTLTKDKIIRRNSHLKEYTPYNPEEILDGQRLLYATGLFSRVEIVPLDQGLPGLRNLLIQVEDAKPILLTYGIGYQEFERARGTAEISHNNLFGLARSISFRARGSSRERLAQSTYREPRLFNHEIDGFASAFVEHTERPSVTWNRIDFSLQALKRITPQQNFLITTGYQTVNLEDIRVNPLAEKFKNEKGVIQIARVGTSFIQDRRNDPINPSTGSFSTTTFQLASRAIGSEVNFTSFFNQYSFYAPMQHGVLASSVRVGWNQPFGRTKELPITERYFAGGSTTLRGFSFDDARPEGGNVMTIANLEYRVPLRIFPISGVGGALFYDTGNVFATVSDIHFNEFTHTAGFGFRYQTPVGPVRLDLGINLNPKLRIKATPKPGEYLYGREDRFKVFFTLANPF